MSASDTTIIPCWGIGLSRTGTTTLCEALKILGYQRVIHNPRFEDLRNLDGGSDLGVILFYKYLDFRFAGSKFVMTVRSLDEWLPSMKFILNKFPARPIDDVAVKRRMGVYETVAFDRVKLTAAYQRHIEDVQRYFLDRPQDLLVLNIVGGEGWDKLCPFLGKPVPAVPFPHLNSRLPAE
jgi:hypothetical protein